MSTENELATLAGRIETQEMIVSEDLQRLQEAITAGKADGVLAAFQALLDSATSGLEGLKDERTALIIDRAVLINERAVLAVRVSQPDQIITGITQSVKRLLDESDKPSSSSKRSIVLKLDQKEQAAFKDKIVARDQRCVLTGSEPITCEAAHIIPWRFHRDNEAQWEQEYEPHCRNPSDAAFDVRNGILLRNDLNRLYDLHLFTIEFSAGEYQVTVSELDKWISAELQSYDGKIVAFTGNPDEWPAVEFLKHHNRIFKFRQKKLKAAAETENDNLQENRDLSKLADDMWEESQTTSTFLSLE
ncbi:hypothetical protein CcCBS67573_g09920 [Chytriomyces confervae]|uniref:HNH nuclease domain-containing protein n=1 Tax=Chytriomyces confervae TaxID=246404 RepID=A0A507DLQ5_9FUNG|nr:hypothetical protein CcCBS67573_g09920 [Chytriomyces confervae]